MKKIEIYSDWWSRPNPWPSGYGVILRFGNVDKEFSGFEKHSTNNRMELTGVIVWLSKLKEKCDVQVFTDSSYVVNWIEKWWAEKWKSNNWMRTKSEKAINYDLWEKLLLEVSKHKVKFNWVRGHNWHEENERCDELATNEILKNNPKLVNSENNSPHLTNSENNSPHLTNSENNSPHLASPEGEGLIKVWIIENYEKVPNYVLHLSRELRQKQTKSEIILWEILRNRKLNNLKFRRQYAFWRYITDFYCFEKNLVIELDWWIHNIKEQKEYDKIRDEVIQKHKVNILRIKNDEIYSNIESVISKILYFCSSSSPSGEVGWGPTSLQKKIKIQKAWDKCKKCWDIVVKAIPKKKNTKNKSYYYKYYLTCPSCKTNYFVDDAKVMIKKIDI